MPNGEISSFELRHSSFSLWAAILDCIPRGIAQLYGRRAGLGTFIMSDDTTAEEQFIDFKCPGCGEQVSFPKTCAGRAQECFNCNEPVIVPVSGDQGGRVPLPIATAHLTLRKFRGADWKDLMQLFSDDEFFDAAPVKLDGEERVARWLEADAVVKLTSPGTPFILAVQALETPKVIGFLTLRFSDADRLQAVLDLVLHRDSQRHGLGAEAMTGALGFCFKDIALHRVQGFCGSSNTAACRLFEKVGMRREAEFVRDHKVKDQWANTAAYAILREEFEPAAK
jgi:RimJ/RimL family protein N-acetyltransferase